MEFVLLGIAAVIVLWVVATYNSFIKLYNNTDEAWSDIDVQLKRRYDLIPNLIDTVKGYAKHEKGVFEEVTKARTAAMGAKSIHDKELAENQLFDALSRIFAVAENYPNLKASENFQKLQDQLSETEDIIAKARRYYNGNVRELNIKLKTVPSNIIARIFNFKEREFFQVDTPEERNPVKVTV